MKSYSRNAISVILFVGSMSYSNLSAAKPSFSIGSGYPYFGNVELAGGDNQNRYFLQAKVSLAETGYTLGWDHSVSDDNKQSLGVVIGSVGIKDNTDNCSEQSSNGDNPFCSLADILDDEDVRGVGLTYGYHFNGLNQSGFRVRLTLGYGESAQTHHKNTVGGVALQYQF